MITTKIRIKKPRLNGVKTKPISPNKVKKILIIVATLENVLSMEENKQKAYLKWCCGGDYNTTDGLILRKIAQDICPRHKFLMHKEP